MEKKQKKIIAREFLILLSGITLWLLLSIGNSLYENYKEKEYSYKSEILEKKLIELANYNKLPYKLKIVYLYLFNYYKEKNYINYKTIDELVREVHGSNCNNTKDIALALKSKDEALKILNSSSKCNIWRNNSSFILAAPSSL